jgi:hypothetical protein
MHLMGKKSKNNLNDVITNKGGIHQGKNRSRLSVSNPQKKAAGNQKQIVPYLNITNTGTVMDN